uniref:sensor histidine kinase n=1 Tax=Agathobacter sp. TaxID=2021311 RepID=UPI0040563C6F
MSQKMIHIAARIAAYLLCVVSVIGFCLSVLGMIFFAEGISYKEILENGYKNIAGNYSAEAMHYFLDNDMEGLEEAFADIGFRFSIVKMENKAEAEQLLYSNAPEGTEFPFAHHFYSIYPDYNTRNLLGSLYYYEAEKETFTETAYIYDYILDTNKGIFYAETSHGYFEIDYIYVEHDNAIYDYKLQEADGKRCYYNKYYELLLDMTKSSEWEWIRVENQSELIYEYKTTDDSASIEAELYNGEFYIHDDEVRYSVTDDTQYMVYSYAAPETTGLFQEWRNLINFLYSAEDDLEKIQIASLIFFVAGFVWLMYSTKATRETLTLVQKIPVCTYAAAICCTEMGLGALFVIIVKDAGRYSYLTFRTYFTILTEIAAVMVLVGLLFFTNIAARLKAKSFWRYSEFYYLLVPFAWARKKWDAFYCTLQRNSSLVGKSLIIISAVSLIEFAVVLYVDSNYWGAVMPYFMLYKLIEIPLTVILLIQMYTLQQGAKRVASGNLAEPIDTKKMFWEFKKHGEYINKSGEGISLAVEERIKSERLKTELITNVSHDIKTPLTSIINYVDLIKKENIADETLLQYIEVLDRQSARLKKLIEDLMEASKASTGNLTCNPEDCSLEVFLGQLMGEFEEKLNQAGLEVVVTKPEEEIYIRADGRHLWRIMDNLMNNIYKYSLPQTRVYISLEKTGQMVTLIFKNISKSQLNISSDELMERFVRGDSSRNTEGNGLGLSIAQSLVELIDGTMKLDIDGDLFKVTLQFAAVEKKSEHDADRNGKADIGDFEGDSDKSREADLGYSTEGDGTAEEKNAKEDFGNSRMDEKDVAMDAEVKEIPKYKM